MRAGALRRPRGSFRRFARRRTDPKQASQLHLFIQEERVGNHTRNFMSELIIQHSHAPFCGQSSIILYILNRSFCAPRIATKKRTPPRAIWRGLLSFLSFQQRSHALQAALTVDEVYSLGITCRKNTSLTKQRTGIYSKRSFEVRYTKNGYMYSGVDIGRKRGMYRIAQSTFVSHDGLLSYKKAGETAAQIIHLLLQEPSLGRSLHAEGKER